MGATSDVLHDAVHLLRRVGHADGENQERHQHRVRIDGITQPGNNTQLPDHRDQRAADHQQGAAHATGVGVDDQQRGDDREAEEHHHLNQAIDQVAHQLGETDHPDLVLTRTLLPGLVYGAVGELEFVTQALFEQAGKLVVIDALAGGRGFVQQRHDQHARLEITGHQAADDAGTADVLPQLFDVRWRALIAVRHHRAALEALLGDFGPAHGRTPQRFHPGAIDALHEEQFVIDLLENRQVVRIENIALGVLHHHAHRVAQTSQRLAVLQVVLDVGLALRNHFFEAGAQLQACHSHEAQHHGGQRHEQHEQRAMVEYQPFQQIAGVPVEVRQFADHRHGVLLQIAHVWVLTLILIIIRRTAYAHRGRRPAPAHHCRPMLHRRPAFARPAASIAARHCRLGS
ncbi:hypothetical protein D3C76_761180 [compost metagenome]